MSVYKGTTKVAGNSAVHTHTNKNVIDKFSEVSGVPYYDGNPIEGGSTAFIGTSDEWDALSASEKAKYDDCQVILVDDYEIQAKLDDSSTSSTSVWSSSKVDTMLESITTVSTFEVGITGWVEDTTSQSGTTLYKKQISLNNVYVSSPSVDIGASGVLPTSAEQESYNLLQYVTVDSAIPCLYLYASDIPTTAFYINVEGCD